MNNKNLVGNGAKRSKFVIKLGNENNNEMGTYRVSKELFFAIKKEIEPFRSLGIQAKPVRCIETGRIFKSAREVEKWLHEQNLTNSYSAVSIIKSACKDEKRKAYGYHWKFA